MVAEVGKLELTFPITQDARTYLNLSACSQVYNNFLNFKVRANRVVQQCHW